MRSRRVSSLVWVWAGEEALVACCFSRAAVLLSGAWYLSTRQLQKVEMCSYFFSRSEMFAEKVLTFLDWESNCPKTAVMSGRAGASSKRRVFSEEGEPVVSAVGLLEGEQLHDFSTLAKIGAS